MNKALLTLIRPHYRDLQGYVSAGMETPKTDDLIFLNANENPYELAGLEGYSRYPKPQPPELLAAYADAYGVKPVQIVATRGADEAIMVLIKLFCEPGQEAIAIHSPTFGIYGVDARAMPASVIDVPLIREGDTFRLDVDGLIAAADKAKLIFICSPNNPTGTSFAHEDIAAICRAVEGKAAVVLDETYAEFAAVGSMTEQLEALPNLIILRTLSKSYALAGMRMGSLLCGDEAFITLVKTKALDAYPLPLESIKAAMSALSQKETAMDNIGKLRAERERIAAALSENVRVKTVYDSDANFLLVKMDGAHDFVKFCAEHKVIIRDFSGKPETANCIRLTISTPEHNDKVLELLGAFAP